MGQQIRGSIFGVIHDGVVAHQDIVVDRLLLNIVHPFVELIGHLIQICLFGYRFVEAVVALIVFWLIKIERAGGQHGDQGKG